MQLLKDEDYLENNANGFSLIELLIVLAILLVLCGILFPVFSSVRKNARKASCANNLKNIGIALQMYSKDYNGYFPYNTAITQHCSWAESMEYYIPEPTIFNCPEKEDGNFIKGCVAEHPGNYYINSFKSTPKLIKNINILNPSGKIVVTEGKGSSNGIFRIPKNSPINSPEDLKPTAIEIRHLGGSNQLFVDGHVKWLSLQQLASNKWWYAR